MAGEVFTVEIQSNVPETIRSDLTGLVRAARKAVPARGKRVARAISSEVRRAGLRERLARAIGHTSRDIEGGVESKIIAHGLEQPYSDASGAGRHAVVNLFDLLQAEEVVSGTVRRLLAIPLPAAGTGPRGRRARVSDFPPGSLIAIFRGDHGILVSKLDRTKTPLFILTPSTKRGKYLSTWKSWEAFATAGLADDILSRWARERIRLPLRRVA